MPSDKLELCHLLYCKSWQILNRMFTILHCLPFAQYLQDCLFLEQETPPMLWQMVIAGGNIFIIVLDGLF